jgi:signal transduction histidine kinase
VGLSRGRAFRHFVDRLPPLASDAHRLESVLATARVFLGLISTLVCVLIGLWGTSSIRTLVLAYVLYSGIVWSFLRSHSTSWKKFPAALQTADVVWAVVIADATGGAASPLLGFFIFVVLEAAYRWGMLATTGTVVATVCFLFVQTAGSAFHSVSPFDVAIASATNVGIGGLLLGYMAEREKQLRVEITTIARLTALVRAEVGIVGSLKALFPELLQLFGARAVVLVAQEPRHGRLYLWQAENLVDAPVRFGELVPSERDMYLFPMGGEAWYAVSAASGLRPAVEVFSLESDGSLIQNVSSPIPDRFAARHPFFSLIGVSLGFGGEWDDRLYLLDPSGDVRELPFILRLVRQLGPVLHSIYLQGRVRSRVAEMERARVGRELHDSTVQSLIGLEMELAAWRRGIDDSSPLTGHLSRIQQRVREEVVSLRELMQRLRPINVEPKKLMNYLSELVDRFQRETGIAACFASAVERVDMSQQMCCELVRIVQEALVNVRKHSGARNVLVVFGQENGRWELVVDDDGRGFDFTGRCSHSEMDGELRGPAVIKERVRVLGGELVLDSDPRRGSRLEITVPGAVHV